MSSIDKARTHSMVTSRQTDESATSGQFLRRWGAFATLSVLASLQFGLTACGDSNATAVDALGAAQVEKSPDAKPPETESGDSSVAAAGGTAAVTPASASGQDASESVSELVPPQTTPVQQQAIRFSALSILPLGDSMTAGNEAAASSYRSYRGALYQMLKSAGHDVDFVGTLKQVPAVGGDADHNGYGGAQIGPGGGANSLSERVSAILGAVGEVDVIVLALGWNSAYQEPAYAAAKYEGLVRQIVALRPNAILVLATLSPQRAETEQQTNAQLTGYRELNAKARELAKASPTDNLILADLAAAGFQAEEYWDVIHWLQPGADRAARAIFDTLTANASIVNAR